MTAAELEAYVAALDKHWEVVLQQKLTGLAARLCRRLEHEISEIQLCLTGERPNLQMALDRLSRVADIIAVLRSE